MNRFKRWRLPAITAVVAAGLMVPASAGAFGTINGMGQHAEHEKITKALSCGADDSVTPCFESNSMSMLAGSDGTVGGVGLPDRVTEIIGNGDAHCDDADYLPGQPYAPGDAERAVKAIDDCVDLFGRHVREAVELAGGLATQSGIVDAQAGYTEGCPWDDVRGNLGIKGPVADFTATVKCRVVDKLGRALHAAEDFWSHSNWGDSADPDKPTILSRDGNDGTPTFDLKNPPGLGHTEVVPFMLYPVAQDQLPTAAEMLAGEAPISGCDDSADDYYNKGWAVANLIFPHRFHTDSCPDRVTHSTLNKDKGIIDWKTGKTSDPETSRGKIGDNFQLAVTGARKQVRAIWGDFVDAIGSKYGETRGGLILRALTRDTPWTDCRLAGRSPFVNDPPNGGKTALRSVTTQIRNETGQPFTCGEAVLNTGVWASAPIDSIENASSGTFRTESNILSVGENRREYANGGPEGSATYAIGTTGYSVKVSWDNPIVGSNSYGCVFLRDGKPVKDAPYSCNRSGGSGNDSKPTFTVGAR